MIADNLFEWDRTSFGQGVKNWATRQRDEWMGTPDAMARQNVRLAANKLYAAWRMYLVQTPANPPLQGTNVDLANFITRHYGEDKIAPLNNLVPNILPPTPPPPPQAESRRRDGRLVEAPVQQQQGQSPPPPPPAQPAQAAQPAPPPQPQQPAQPPQPGVLTRAQVDQVLVALARIMLDSGEAKPGMKQRNGRDDGDSYDSDRGRGGGGGARAGMKISELTNVKISAAALDYAERSTRVKLTDANHILALIKNNMQPTIAELVKKYPVTGNNMLVLLAAAQAS